MSNRIQFYNDLVSSRIRLLSIDKEPKNLYDPIQYILDLGGKRLRPILTLLSHALFSDYPEKTLDPAVGVEVFHNFTLMHDDILDQAPLRRGMATVHEKWEPNIAILSGDVMLVKAYELLMKVPDNRLRVVLETFNRCAQGVCEGQQADMDFELEKEVSAGEYLEMIRLKTAVLIGFSMELGAIIGGASEEDIRALREFGVNMGIGFQLKDDILDIYGDHKKFGKQVGGDIVANKKTFLWIKAREYADEKLRVKLDYWESKKTFVNQEKVQEITEIYDTLDVKKASEGIMNSYFDKALNILDTLDVPAGKKSELIAFSKKLIARDH